MEELDLMKIMNLLNEILARDPDAVTQLMMFRPAVNDELKEYLGMNGDRMTFLGIINAILKAHGENEIVLGADCEFERGIITDVKFFHLIDMTKKEE